MPTGPLIRYLLVLLGGFVAGGRAVAAIDAWREWHAWETSDPSLADSFRTEFWLQLTLTGITLAAAYVVFRMLRPRGEP
ncbi:MAG TPA: hypothetical protein VEB59_08270 [Gemmatimonadales bacterium]|nr:hypothetical protein [Gemmatimonadales bacterium]